MNSFDHVIIDFILKYISRPYYFFYMVEFMTEDNMLKGGVVVILFWYLWFKTDPANLEKRVQLVATLISVFCVMVITLSLSGLVPFRQRPFLNQDFNFTPLIPDYVYLKNMSSFPSDHAALFMSLATGFLFVSRKTGIIVMLLVFIYILFPRLYMGYHYPTDLLAGTLIGVSFTAFFIRSEAIKNTISKRVIPFSEDYPAYFYSLLFLFTYQIADLFGGCRDILSFIHQLYKHQF